MSRRFQHLGQEWDATSTGTGHGVGFGHIPQIDRWGVIFRSVSNQAQGAYRSSISNSDPSNVSEDELKGALEEQLVLEAINRSRYTWRPAEAISRDTGIPLDRVQHILEHTRAADVMSGPLNTQGLLLYTTRDHFVNTTGDLMRRYQHVDESS